MELDFLLLQKLYSIKFSAALESATAQDFSADLELVTSGFRIYRMNYIYGLESVARDFL